MRTLLVVLCAFVGVSAHAFSAIEDDIRQQIAFDPEVGEKVFSTDAHVISEMSVALGGDFGRLLADGRTLTYIRAHTVKAPSGVSDRIEFFFRAASFNYSGLSAQTKTAATLTVNVDRICGAMPTSPCHRVYSIKR